MGLTYAMEPHPFHESRMNIGPVTDSRSDAYFFFAIFLLEVNLAPAFFGRLDETVLVRLL
jgi:hypothetical protein